MRIEESHDNIVVLSGIRRRRAVASSPFGPVRAGLITSLRTNEEAQLTELLNSLESVVANLNYKSSTALDTLLTATQGVRAALNATPIDAGGTKV